MERDVALLDAAAEEGIPPTLRFYAWNPPAVSLGRFQSEAEIDRAYLARRGWDLVRRPTGGRAVLHHLELTYSLVLPPSIVAGAGVRTSYAVLSRALNQGLAGLLSAPVTAPAPGCEVPARGVVNCFALASECDTLVPGGKLVGSAQVRRQGALLQHGSILLDAEPEAWAALFGDAGRLVTLKQLLGAVPEMHRVEAAVLHGFAAQGIRFAAGDA